MSGSVVECAVCGNRMAIPPGFEGREATCRQCGTIVGGAGQDDVLGAPKKTLAVPKRQPTAKERFADGAKIVAKHALAAGAIGAVAFAMLGPVISLSLGYAAAAVIPASAAFGATLGAILGGTWAAGHRADVGLLGCIILGIGLAVPLCGVNMYFLASPKMMPEANPLEFLIVGVLGGGMCGALVSLIKPE